MTPEQIKEALSRGFVQLLANRDGFKCQKPEPDSGVDLSITRSRTVNRGGKIRLLDTGEYIEVQLKSTTEASIQREHTSIKYDLEAKTYNDLIDRSDTAVPLYLVLVVLPTDSALWLNVEPQQLILRGCAYWYQPTPSDSHTSNASTYRIEIPNVNLIGTSFVRDRFEEVYG